MTKREQTIAEILEDALYECFPGPRVQGPRLPVDEEAYQLHFKPWFGEILAKG